eukprot:scaffold41771_cov32-Tisochrysis_lutea.AAC.4
MPTARCLLLLCKARVGAAGSVTLATSRLTFIMSQPLFWFSRALPGVSYSCGTSSAHCRRGPPHVSACPAVASSVNV